MPGLIKVRSRNFLYAALVLLVFSNVKAESWTDKIKFKGDFRYRHELTAEENKEQRIRHRIRARIGMFADVSDGVTFGFQMTSGSSDPVSNNQTLGDGFSTKNLGIDFAYFEVKPGTVKGLKLLGGKFKNPWYKPGKSELIWDSDWNPEGLFASYKTKDLGSIEIFVDAAMFWVEERSSTDDALLVGGQGGLTFKLMDENAYVTVGGSYYSYLNAKDYQPFVDPEDGFGNSLGMAMSEDGNSYYYLYDYNLLEVFFEAGGKLQNLPVTIMVDYVTNSGADKDNTGYLAGIHVGKVKEWGTIAARYIYREVQKDAVLGAYTDSDFIGGGTDGKGHEFGVDLGLTKNISTSASFFVNQIGVNNSKDFKRLQVDLNFKF